MSVYFSLFSHSARPVALYNQCVIPLQSTGYDNTMRARIFHPLLALIASATDRELAKYVEYLKEENKILRARIPGQIHTKPEERQRLLKLGKAIGQAIEELITIVSPATFYRWVRDAKSGKPSGRGSQGGGQGPKELRTLVLEIAKTTGFGYTRIIGELRKLGIRKISRQTVRNILKEEGIEPGPNRKNDCWKDFLDRHAETLWAVDFFSVKTVTTRGLRDMYVLVWLCMSTREVVVSESTEHPNSAWVKQQVDVFADRTAGLEKKPAIVMHDKDRKFDKVFTATVKERGMRTNSLPKASPNLNGRCERFIETIKLECLSKFIVFGKRHLDYLVGSFADYYNHHRSHMERDNLPPIRKVPEEVDVLTRNQIEVRPYVGGLVKSFERTRSTNCMWFAAGGRLGGVADEAGFAVDLEMMLGMGVVPAVGEEGGEFGRDGWGEAGWVAH